MPFKVYCIIRMIGIFSLWASKTLASSWTYNKDQGGGPDHWMGLCGTGLSQSPIDIPIANNKVLSNSEPFIFKYYDNKPKIQKITNNGHSIQLTIVENTEPKMQPKLLAGGLPGRFQFEQLHFHWGSSDDHGSEHLIGGKKYPMEVHLVHYNIEFGTRLSEAVVNGGGSFNTLAVLGIMFDIQKSANVQFAPIVDALKNVRYVNQEHQKMDLFPLMDLLPRNTDMFYRYNGSLTTPSCGEIVVWTVFKDPIFISSYQMNQFRKVLEVTLPSGNLLDSDHEKNGHERHPRSPLLRRTNDEDNTLNQNGISYMVNNYRPVMPLNNRTILDVDTSRKRFSSSASISLPVSTLTLAITITASKLI